MIYTTGTIAVSGNALTGTGTNFTAAGSLIRNGCTILTMTTPMQVFQITGITSATQMTVTPAASPALAAGTKYAILLSDSLSTDGLAQGIAEVVNMYQSNMSGFVDVMNGTGDVTITVDGSQIKVPGQKSLAKKGANSDITSLSGLTTALSVAQGGTGAKDAEGIRKNAGLGTAATKDVGLDAGNIARIGDFCLGVAKQAIPTVFGGQFIAESRGKNDNAWTPNNGAGFQSSYMNQRNVQLFISGDNRMYYRWSIHADPAVSRDIVPWLDVYTSANTSKASDGTLKAASPVARIANKENCSRSDINEDSFEWCGYGVANEEARGIKITREDTGVYRVTGAKSLASAGWRLLPPRDPDGSGDLGVVTSEQRNDEIIIMLFRRRMALVDGEIIIQPGEPIDVPVNSWIDVRLDMPDAVILDSEPALIQPE